jgi:hypothetical protein
MGRMAPVAEYGSFAEVYTAENGTGLVNVYYERPAMLELTCRIGHRRSPRCGACSSPMAVNVMHRQEGPRPDYFAAYTWTDEMPMQGRTVPMTFWYKPLQAMTDAFTAAGAGGT